MTEIKCWSQTLKCKLHCAHLCIAPGQRHSMLGWGYLHLVQCLFIKSGYKPMVGFNLQKHIENVALSTQHFDVLSVTKHQLEQWQEFVMADYQAGEHLRFQLFDQDIPFVKAANAGDGNPVFSVPYFLSCRKMTTWALWSWRAAAFAHRRFSTNSNRAMLKDAKITSKVNHIWSCW